MRRRPGQVGEFRAASGLLPEPESKSPLRDLRRGLPLDARFKDWSKLPDMVSMAVSVTRLLLAPDPLGIVPPGDPLKELHPYLTSVLA